MANLFQAIALASIISARLGNTEVASQWLRRWDELRVRAARHGRSMEAELRRILKEALGGEKRAEPNLAEAIRRRFLPLGGADELEPHPPVTVRDPPRFDR